MSRLTGPCLVAKQPILSVQRPASRCKAPAGRTQQTGPLTRLSGLVDYRVVLVEKDRRECCEGGVDK